MPEEVVKLSEKEKAMNAASRARMEAADAVRARMNADTVTVYRAESKDTGTMAGTVRQRFAANPYEDRTGLLWTGDKSVAEEHAKHIKDSHVLSMQIPRHVAEFAGVDRITERTHGIDPKALNRHPGTPSELYLTPEFRGRGRPVDGPSVGGPGDPGGRTPRPIEPSPDRSGVPERGVERSVGVNHTRGDERIVGKLLEAGPAPYKHDPQGSPSYFARVQTDKGIREVWGQDLERAFLYSEPPVAARDVGRDVALQNLGPVEPGGRLKVWAVSTPEGIDKAARDTREINNMPEPAAPAQAPARVNGIEQIEPEIGREPAQRISNKWRRDAAPADGRWSGGTAAWAQGPTKQQPERKAEEQQDAKVQRAVGAAIGNALEERFNVVNKRFGLGTDYYFRDAPGRLAFTTGRTAVGQRTMTTTSDSPAAVKGMMDKAELDGWRAFKIKDASTPEFKRQAWIAAEARGIKAVGYEPTPGDLTVAAEERARLAKERDVAAIQPGGRVIIKDRVTHEIKASEQSPAEQGRTFDSEGMSQPGPATPAQAAPAQAVAPRDRRAELNVTADKLDAETKAAAQAQEASATALKVIDRNNAETLGIPQDHIKGAMARDMVQEDLAALKQVTVAAHREEALLSMGHTAANHKGYRTELRKQDPEVAKAAEKAFNPEFARAAERPLKHDPPAQAAPATEQEPQKARAISERDRERAATAMLAFEASLSKGNVPEKMRKPLREAAQKVVDESLAHHKPIKVAIYDPNAPKPPAERKIEKAPKRTIDQEMAKTIAAAVQKAITEPEQKRKVEHEISR